MNHFSKPFADYDPARAPRLSLIFTTLERILGDGDCHNYQDVFQQCVKESTCIEKTVYNQISRLIKSGEIVKVNSSARYRSNTDIYWKAARDGYLKSFL